MWRRLTAFSPRFSSSSSKPSHLLQVPAVNGFKIWQGFCTEIYNQAEGGISSRKTTPSIAFVLGGPGSGKGTQCTRIVDTYGFTHISAGELLRKEMGSNSEYSDMIEKIMKEGTIAPSEVTVKLLRKAIESGENDRFLIDGFPRSEENRIAYEKIIRAEPNFVLFFDCPEEVMIERVLNRNEGRLDDNEETVRARLKTFRAVSFPVIEYYAKKGKLYKIDGTGTEDEIFEQVRPIFSAFR
ncbi:PREDICTED: UMP-CMP kinase 3 [Ipomoea nil]|uniref:UMP-CMP kinase 3 n=1 Tax=Ipomoea nil TaxID=35883 RepID=UPI000901AD7E|nr:PREDICTED: UMP-CMP kinase 3 [Ipomoea nil]